MYTARYSHMSHFHIWVVNPILLCSCVCPGTTYSHVSWDYIQPCDFAGEKLIEHLKKWLDTTKLLETPHSWEPGQESDIAAAILELFHLLPQQASKFLETQGVSQPQLTLLALLHCMF